MARILDVTHSCLACIRQFKGKRGLANLLILLIQTNVIF